MEKPWKPTKTTPTTKKPKEKTTNNKQTTNNAYHTVKHSKPHDTTIFPHFNQQPKQTHTYKTSSLNKTQQSTQTNPPATNPVPPTEAQTSNQTNRDTTNV